MTKRNGLVIDEDGTNRWYKDGQYHRDGDLPAVIYADGEQCWYCNDKLHRDNDLPAVTYADGKQEWYVNGAFIKSTGPCPLRAQAIAMQRDMEDD